MNEVRKAKAPLTLSPSAVKRVKSLMERAEKPVLGIRVGVTNKGCSGHSYQVEYATEARPLEEVIEQEGARVYIDPLALMFIIGSTMDFVEGKLQSGFTFTNPNAKSQCGCGESFSV
jgi:iron-sulfur cluster assembly protein